MTNWKLFLDDERNPTDEGWTVARSSIMAIVTITKRKRLPKMMSLDHDLGDDDNTMKFLKELYEIWVKHGSNVKDIPNYIVHSANPVGSKNIISFMESWKKSAGHP